MGKDKHSGLKRLVYRLVISLSLFLNSNSDKADSAHDAPNEKRFAGLLAPLLTIPRIPKKRPKKR